MQVEGPTRSGVRRKAAINILEEKGWLLEFEAIKHRLKSKRINVSSDVRSPVPDVSAREPKNEDQSAFDGMSHPTTLLGEICKKKLFVYKYHDFEILSNLPPRVRLSITMGKDKITVEAATKKEAKIGCAQQMLERKKWTRETLKKLESLSSHTIDEKAANFESARFQLNDLDLEDKKCNQDAYSFDERSEVTISHDSMSLQDRKALYDNPLHSDVRFVVGKSGSNSQSFFGHSFIIAPASPVLSRLFKSDWNDKDQLIIEGCPSSFESILRFIYCQKVWYDKQTLPDLLGLCKKFGMRDLIDKIMDTKPNVTEVILKEHLSIVLEAAHRLNNCGLWRIASNFYYNNPRLLEGDVNSSVKTMLLVERSPEIKSLAHQSPQSTPETVCRTIKMDQREMFGLLNNPRDSDIKFIVSTRDDKHRTVLFGHKKKIASYNSHFEGLFEGEWKLLSEIHIESKPRAFLSLLRYVYLNKVWYESEDFSEVFSLSKQYRVIGLWRELAVKKKHLTDKVMEEHLWDLLEFAHSKYDASFFHFVSAYFIKHYDRFYREPEFERLDPSLKVLLLPRGQETSISRFTNDVSEEDTFIPENLFPVVKEEEKPSKRLPKLPAIFHDISFEDKKCQLKPNHCNTVNPLWNNSDANRADDQNCSVTSDSKSLLNNPDKSDITFFFGKASEESEKIFAHRDILNNASPIFRKLLFGEWNGKKEVGITFEASAFMVVLQFIYTNKLKIQSKNLLEVLNIANLYGLTRLKNEVVAKIGDESSGLLKRSLYSILLYAQEKEDRELFAVAVKYFDRNAEILLCDDALLLLDAPLMTRIIKRTSLHVSERDLFYAVTYWASEQCREEGLDQRDPKNLRSKMQPFIHHIRFPTMEAKEFRDGPAVTKILKPLECYNILCAICLEEPTDYEAKTRVSGFNSYPRDTE